MSYSILLKYPLGKHDKKILGLVKIVLRMIIYLGRLGWSSPHITKGLALFYKLQYNLIKPI